MKTRFVEATNGSNWGKFMVAQFDDEEWCRRSEVEEVRLLEAIGWDHPNRRNVAIVYDLQTCEGAAFRIGGSAHADLEKHKIWVCPLFEPFLEWLYEHWAGLNEVNKIDALPPVVHLDAEFSMYGYRREGGE